MPNDSLEDRSTSRLPKRPRRPERELHGERFAGQLLPASELLRLQDSERPPDVLAVDLVEGRRTGGALLLWGPGRAAVPAQHPLLLDLADALPLLCRQLQLLHHVRITERERALDLQGDLPQAVHLRG